MNSLSTKLNEVVARQDKMDVKLLRRESAGMGIHHSEELESSFSAQARQRKWEEELDPESIILSCFSEPTESEEVQVAMARGQALSTLTVSTAMGRRVPVYDRGGTVMRIFDVTMLYADVMDEYLAITTKEEQQQQMDEYRQNEEWDQAKSAQVRQELISTSAREDISLIANPFEDGEDEAHFTDEEMFDHGEVHLKTTFGGTRRVKSQRVNKFPVVKHTKKSALCDKENCYMLAATNEDEPLMIDLRRQTKSTSGCDRLLCDPHQRNVMMNTGNWETWSMKPMSYEQVTMVEQKELICIYSQCKKSTVQEMCPKTEEPMLACRRGHFRDHVEEMNEACALEKAAAKDLPVPEAKTVASSPSFSIRHDVGAQKVHESYDLAQRAAMLERMTELRGDVSKYKKLVKAENKRRKQFGEWSKNQMELGKHMRSVLGEESDEEVKETMRLEYLDNHPEMSGANPFRNGGASVTQLLQMLDPAKESLSAHYIRMGAFRPHSENFKHKWPTELLGLMDNQQVDTSDDDRPAGAKKVTRKTREHLQPKSVAEAIAAAKRRNSRVAAASESSGKSRMAAVKNMFDTAALAEGEEDDDLTAYAGKDLDAFEDDGFLRSETSHLSEYSPGGGKISKSNHSIQSNTIVESSDDDEDDVTEEEDEDEEFASTAAESEEEEKEARADARPSDEELLKLPKHPLHVTNVGGERKKQDETIRTLASLVLLGLRKIGIKRKVQKEKNKKVKTTIRSMQGTVDAWSDGPKFYVLTKAMRKALEDWNKLSVQQMKWSNEIHEKRDQERVHMPCKNVPKVSRETNAKGKLVEKVHNYVGHVDERHEYALINFMRGTELLKHCKPMTAKQEEDTIMFFHMSGSDEIMTVTKDVARGAAEIYKQDWPGRTIPAKVGAAKRSLDLTREEEGEYASDEGSHDDEHEESAGDIFRRLDEAAEEKSPRSSRRMSTETELLVDGQAKAAAATQEASEKMILLLAKQQQETMASFAKSMDRSSKPAALDTCPVLDKHGHEVYSLEQFQAIAGRYRYQELAQYLQTAQRLSKVQHTTKASQLMDSEMNELDMDIENNTYVGPGSGKNKLPDGSVDPDDHIKNEAYYEVLVKRFYKTWKGLFGEEVIHQKDQDARDQCDRKRLKTRMYHGGGIREFWYVCMGVKSFYTTKKEVFTLKEQWGLFLLRIKPRRLRTLLQADKVLYKALKEGEYNFDEFTKKVKKDYNLDTAKRNDSAANAPYDDAGDQKDYMTDEEGKLSKSKTTTKPKPNPYAKGQKVPLPDMKHLSGSAAKIQPTERGGRSRSAKKNTVSQAFQDSTQALLRAITEEKANEQLDMSQDCNKAYYKAKDGDLKGACPLGPHREFIEWRKCSCLRGTTWKGTGDPPLWCMDLRHGLEVAGGQSSELYKLMHRTGKNATTLRKLWDVKAHFRNHLMTEKENKLVSKIQAATASKASTSASLKKLAVIEKVANKLSGGSSSSFVQAVTAMGRNFDDEDMFGPVLNESVQVPDDHETDETVTEVAIETVEMVSTATEEIECAVCYSLSDNLSKLDDHLDKYQVKSTFSHNKNYSCVDCVMKSLPTPLKMGKISPDEVEDITYRAGQEFAMQGFIYESVGVLPVLALPQLSRDEREWTTAQARYKYNYPQPDYLHEPRSMGKEKFLQGLVSKSRAGGVQLTRDMISATLLDQLYDSSVQHREQDPLASIYPAVVNGRDQKTGFYFHVVLRNEPYESTDEESIYDYETSEPESDAPESEGIDCPKCIEAEEKTRRDKECEARGMGGKPEHMHCHDPRCDGVARKDHNGKCSFCTFDTESESEGEGKQEEEDDALCYTCAVRKCCKPLATPVLETSSYAERTCSKACETNLQVRDGVKLVHDRRNPTWPKYRTVSRAEVERARQVMQGIVRRGVIYEDDGPPPLQSDTSDDEDVDSDGLPPQLEHSSDDDYDSDDTLPELEYCYDESERVNPVEKWLNAPVHNHDVVMVHEWEEGMNNRVLMESLELSDDMHDCYRGKEMRCEYNGLCMRHGVDPDYDPYLVVQPDSTVPVSSVDASRCL